METQPLPVAAATIPTPATTVEEVSLCHHCREIVSMTETGFLYTRRGRIVAIACVPCAHARKLGC